MRDLASVVCNLQHKCNEAMRHLLLPAQQENPEGHIRCAWAVAKIDPLQNDSKQGKQPLSSSSGSGTGAEKEISTETAGKRVHGVGGKTGEWAARAGLRQPLSKDRRRVAERDLANASVVGIDSESGLSATEDFVQRRDAVVSTLAHFSAALSERENN